MVRGANCFASAHKHSKVRQNRTVSQKTENGSQQQPSKEVCKQKLHTAVRISWCCNVHTTRSSKAVGTVLFVEVFRHGSSVVHSRTVTVSLGLSSCRTLALEKGDRVGVCGRRNVCGKCLWEKESQPGWSRSDAQLSFLSMHVCGTCQSARYDTLKLL